MLGKSDPDLGGGPAGGIAELGGKNSYLQYGQSVQLGFHELGHNFDYGHPDKDEADYKTNPMGYAPGNLSYSRDQLKKIYDRARVPGLLNKGFNDRSTNERPYKGARTFNMIIPERISNPNK